jgi:hypothetical protein
MPAFGRIIRLSPFVCQNPRAQEIERIRVNQSKSNHSLPPRCTRTRATLTFDTTKVTLRKTDSPAKYPSLFSVPSCSNIGVGGTAAIRVNQTKSK